MRKHLLVGFFLCFANYAWAQKTTTLRIDPNNARGGTASEVFDSINFIPLETTKESLFGAIGQLEVTDSFFIILDSRNQAILLFQKNGKFHCKIVSGGLNRFFSYFGVDRDSNHIIVPNNFANALLVYDFGGNLIRKQPCPDRTWTLYDFGSRHIVYNINRPFERKPDFPDPYDLAYSNGFNAVVKRILPYNPKFEDHEFNTTSDAINYAGVPGYCMYITPFYYTAYQLCDTGINAAYKFIFPSEYSLPPGFSTDSSFEGHRADYAYRDPGNRKIIASVETVYRIGNYLLFSAHMAYMRFGSDWNYLYNLDNGDLVSFSKVLPDSSTCFLAVANSVLEPLCGASSGYVYSSIPSFVIFRDQGNASGKIIYPPAMQTFMQSGKRTDNCVIVQFHLRPNL